MKKHSFLLLAFNVLFTSFLLAQGGKESDKRTQSIYALIDNYSLARDKKDTVLLKRILTTDVDQLVSTGEWRNGIGEVVQGMQRSSSSNPGSRTLTVEKIRFLEHFCSRVSRGTMENCRYPKYVALRAAVIASSRNLQSPNSPIQRIKFLIKLC